MSFPERLKELRKKANLTQTEIAKKMKVGQNSYSNWEKGKRTPIRPTIEKLAEVLDTTPEYLLGETNDESIKNNPTFTRRLKTLRLEAELTQKQLAEEIQTSQQNVNHWESGNRNPKHEMLIKLANFFDVSTDYLTGKSNSTVSPKDIQEAINKSVAYNGNEISDEDRLVITEFLEDYFTKKHAK